MVYLRALLQLGICSAFMGLLLSCGGSSGASLQSIEITPSTGSAAAGTTAQLMATGIYSDGGHRDVTYDATWSSSNSAVANVNPGGVASAAAQGSTKISATFQGVTGSSTLTVTAATLVSLEVTPSLASIAKGRTLQFVATGIFSDNSTQNLSSQVTWSTSDGTLATISSASGSMGVATATGTGSVTISATSGSITGSTTLTVTGAVLTSIEITPPTPSIAKGVSQQFVAMGIFSDNTTQNLTTQVTWASTATGVATVSNSAPTIGMVTATGVGTTALSANTGSISANIQVIVTPALLVAIQVDPPTPSIAAGLSQQYAAIGIYTDNSTQYLTVTATWATTASNVATVSNAAGSQGLATSSSPGTATISASLNGVSGSAALTVTPATLVSIAVTPTNSTIPKGLTSQMRAVGTYTDHSTQDLTTKVTFSSGTPAVATISNASGSQGLATSASVGSTIITASLGGVAGTTTLTIGAPTLVSIQVTASNHSVAGTNQTQQFVATGTYTDASTQPLTTQVMWSSSATAVATISNAPGSQGVATSVAVGSTTITAASGLSISGTSTFSVTPAILQTIAVTPADATIFDSAQPAHMIATGTYNDATTMDLTTSVTWTSSNTAAATISNVAPTKGFATPAGDGVTTIKAAVGAIFGTTSLTITAATLQSIAVTFDSPVSDGSTHTVTQQAIATGTYNDNHTADLTTQVTWSSADPNVASFDDALSPGLATWKGLGGTLITASLTPVSGSSTLTVAAPTSLQVSASSLTITGIGLTQQFVATGGYPSGVNLDLTRLVSWSSSPSSVATISDTGVATSATGVTALNNTSTIGASIGTPAVTASQVLTVNQSFANGTMSVYSLLGSFPAPSDSLACKNCHASPNSGTGSLQASPVFYITAPSGGVSAATLTYNTMSADNLFDAGGAYDQACVTSSSPMQPPAGMPSYAGTELCTVLNQWLAQGAPDN